jgi:hypothetical protein
MANAAAKKAAAAKRGTSSTFLPLIMIANVIHLILLYSLSSDISKKRMVLTIIEWLGTYISYQGILQDAEVGKLTRDKNQKKNIPGGIYLDILGLIVFVQFGAIFIGSFINWILLIAPALYGVIKWIGSRNGNNTDQSNETEKDGELKKQLDERRRKRAERRKQKRG